jgi:diketogulonate reductase-like aldo/keto reductase
VKKSTLSDLLPSPSRRQFVNHVGTGAAAAVLGQGTSQSTPANAPPVEVPADIITKTIPRTGETVPAIGMGSFMTFDVLPGQSRDNLREVVRRFYEGGGRVIDTSPLYGNLEVNVGDLPSGLGLTDKLFFTDKMWVTGEYLSDDSRGRRSLDQSMRRLWRNEIDVVQVHSLTNVEIMVPFLNEMKAQGRIRYVGVTHHDAHYFEPLAWWVENGPIDFVQVHTRSIRAMRSDASCPLRESGELV